MPARAANHDEDRPPTHTTSTGPTGYNNVVPLASRRNGRTAGHHDAPVPAGPNVDTDTPEQRVAQYWTRVLGDAGLDLADPTVAATVQAVAGGLERLVGGLLVMRKGGGQRNVEPNPWRGLDDIGAEEMCGLLRELRRAPEVVAEADARVPQQGR